MKLCCGEVPYTNYSLRTGYSMYCTVCRKSLTGDYGQGDEAEFVWAHGPEGLPAKCPFCCFPARIVNPMGEAPKVGCTFTNANVCVIAGQLFPIERWYKPTCWNVERFATRWEKRQPNLANVLKALRRAVALDIRGRFMTDPKKEPCRKPRKAT
jgi:hypothetical protein